MKNLFIICGLIIFSSLHCYAQEVVGSTAIEIKPVTLKMSGIIIDNKSAEKYHDDLNVFVQRYPKAQAVLPVSVECGYSFYTDGELYKFDKKSNEKIVEFLQERNNILKVTIEARENGDELDLISIQNEYLGVGGAKYEPRSS